MQWEGLFRKKRRRVSLGYVILLESFVNFQLDSKINMPCRLSISKGNKLIQCLMRVTKNMNSGKRIHDEVQWIRCHTISEQSVSSSLLTAPDWRGQSVLPPPSFISYCGGRMDRRPGKSLQTCWAEPRNGMWWQEEADVFLDPPRALHDAHRQRSMLAMKTLRAKGSTPFLLPPSPRPGTCFCPLDMMAHSMLAANLGDPRWVWQRKETAMGWGGPSNSLFSESKILYSQRFHEIMFIVLKSLSLELDNGDSCMSLWTD